MLFAPTWLRGFFMILFVAILMVARMVIFAIMAFQFGSLLLHGSLNARLLILGESFSTYSYQVVCYLTFNIETKPFPFSDWPMARDESNTIEPLKNKSS